MKAGLLWPLARLFGTLSLVAVGGANALVPELHRQVVQVRGWMDDAAFADTFAIAQAAPGPNVLVVSLIGWRLAGWPGLLVATLAMILPACLLAWAAGRLVRRLSGAVWLAVLQAGLVPIAVGLILASGLVMARAADHGALGVAITGGAAAFVALTGRNPLWAIAGGTALALAAAHV